MRAYRRAGKPEDATKVLTAIHPQMAVKENQSYLRTLLLYKGLRTEEDVRLELFVAGERIAEYVHADGEGWQPFAFSTARFAGQTQTVEFGVQSAKMWQRWFCFEAQAR